MEIYFDLYALTNELEQRKKIFNFMKIYLSIIKRC